MVLSAALALSLTACLKRVPTQPKVPAHRAVKLLINVPERQTSELTDLVKDLEVDTHDMDRTPHLVESGETPMIELGGARAKLAGNEAGTEPWSVDNFLLFDVLDANGQRLNSFVVGSAAGVLRGNQRLDNVGQMAFRFEGGEVDVTSHLPSAKPFKLKVTALDFGGVGRVSDVYLVLDRSERESSSDDLRGQ